MSERSSENNSAFLGESFESDRDELTIRSGGSDGRYVLVIEDDPVIVDLIREIVATLNLEVIIADNANDALLVFEESCFAVRCVILDYGIPGMDASRLLLRLREVQPEVKVLLSSGYSRGFIARDFPLDDVSAFIPKPYEPQLLVDAILNMLSPGNKRV